MDDYQTTLLELIAYRLSPGNQEFDDWRLANRERYMPKEDIDNASTVSSATPVHGDLRAQSEALSGEMPVDVKKQDVGVRINLGDKLAAAWKRQPKS